VVLDDLSTPLPESRGVPVLRGVPALTSAGVATPFLNVMTSARQPDAGAGSVSGARATTGYTEVLGGADLCAAQPRFSWWTTRW